MADTPTSNRQRRPSVAENFHFIVENLPCFKFVQQYNIARVLKKFGVEGKTILDVSCGSGHLVSTLADLDAELVIGMSMSERGTEFAREKYPRKNSGYICGDIWRSKLDIGKFDFVVCSYFFLDRIKIVCDMHCVLSKLKRLVKDNGMVILSFDNVYQDEAPDYRPYGFKKTHEGKEVIYSFPSQAVRITETAISPEALIKTLHRHFAGVKVHKQHLQPSEHKTRDYYKTFLIDNPFLLFSLAPKVERNQAVTQRRPR